MSYCCAGENGKSILSWLGESIEQAAKAADEHDSLRSQIRELQAGLEDRFKLAAVQVSTCLRS